MELSYTAVTVGYGRGHSWTVVATEATNVLLLGEGTYEGRGLSLRSLEGKRNINKVRTSVRTELMFLFPGPNNNSKVPQKYRFFCAIFLSFGGKYLTALTTNTSTQHKRRSFTSKWSKHKKTKGGLCCYIMSFICFVLRASKAMCAPCDC